MTLSSCFFFFFLHTILSFNLVKILGTMSLFTHGIYLSILPCNNSREAVKDRKISYTFITLSLFGPTVTDLQMKNMRKENDNRWWGAGRVQKSAKISPNLTTTTSRIIQDMNPAAEGFSIRSFMYAFTHVSIHSDTYWTSHVLSFSNESFTHTISIYWAPTLGQALLQALLQALGIWRVKKPDAMPACHSTRWRWKDVYS